MLFTRSILPLLVLRITLALLFMKPNIGGADEHVPLKQICQVTANGKMAVNLEIFVDVRSTVHVYDLPTRTLLKDIVSDNSTESGTLVFSADGKLLAWNEDHRIVVWFLPEKKQILAIPEESNTNLKTKQTLALFRNNTDQLISMLRSSGAKK